jgi:uncharacterized protein (TIGR02466 family)
MTRLRSQLMAAHAAFVRGEPETTQSLVNEILAVHPDQPDALQLFAGAALRLGQATEAVKALRRARAQVPENVQVLHNLAVAEQAAGQHVEAAAVFRELLIRQPDNPDLRLGMAHALRQAGDARAAIETYQQILVMDAQVAEAGEGLALALADVGDFVAAREQAQRNVAALPARTEAWRTLACVLERDARIDEALTTLDQGAARVADAYPLAIAKGHLAHRAGRFAGAAEAFALATRLRPQAAEAWNNLAACQVRLDRIGEAIASARQASELSPADVGARMTLAAALSHSRDPRQLHESMTLSLAVLAQTPDLAMAHDCIALVQLKLGNMGIAQTHAQRAVEADPGNDGYAVTLSRVLEQKGDLEGAESVLVARVPLRASAMVASAPVLRQLGHVHLLRGHADDAFTSLDKAWRLAPADQTAIAERAIALGTSQGWDMAEAWQGLHEWIVPIEIATPDGFIDRTGFLHALADDIRQHSTLRFEPIGLVAKGGYLTGDLLADRTPAIAGFSKSLMTAIRRFIDRLPDVPGHPFLGQVPRGEHLIHVWATRVCEQGVIDTHIHEGSWLSGAFYVELPTSLNDSDTAGWIEFGRPHPGLPSPPDERLLTVQPQAGMMLFFPSYMFHRTLPYGGQGERISISFDLGPR